MMLRSVYFSLASVWGFGVGVVSLVAAVTLKGNRVSVGAGELAILGSALALAVAGGFIAAAAYRDARRRSRS